jgi:hypothetical protein
MRPPNLSLMAGLLIGSLTVLPAQAHKTEVSGDVAGTWHLEPNHSPKAGEPAQVWVALTQQGGQVVSLEQCDCTLAVYATNQPDAAPIVQPALQAMSPERFQNIPGAEITFPALGEYRLVLTGRPRAGATFAPFELSYITVVAGGSRRPTSTPDQEAAPEVRRLSIWMVGGAVVIAIAALAAVFNQRKSPR